MIARKQYLKDNKAKLMDVARSCKSVMANKGNVFKQLRESLELAKAKEQNFEYVQGQLQEL